MKAKHWYDYLWVYAIIYFALGFFNILFAWLGMIDFLLPLLLAIFGGNKFFCNHLCGRGQLFSKLGTDLKCSRCKPTPRWMSSKWFRYGFLLFFLTMFGIWCSRPIWSLLVLRPYGRPLSCSGHSVCLGAGLIQPVQSLIGWRSSALAFIASC